MMVLGDNKPPEIGVLVQATVAYYLELDNRRRVTSNSYLNNELLEAYDPNLQYPQGPPLPLFCIIDTFRTSYFPKNVSWMY